LRKTLLKALTALLCLFAVTLSGSYSKAQGAASKEPVKLIVDNEPVTYEGTLGKFTYNGKEIKIKKTPTYLFEDTAYINISKVLDKIPGTHYSFNEETGRIRISNNGCSIIFYLDSPLIYKNGIASYSRLMPKVISKDGGKENVYLPGRLVFETLGYNYVWDSQTGTSKVTETAATARIYEIYTTNVLFDNKLTRDVSDFNDRFRVMIPTGVSLSDIKVSDDMYQNKIFITIGGDHRKFYEDLNFDYRCKECVVQVYDEYHLEDDETVVTIVLQSDKTGIFLFHDDEITEKHVTFSFYRASDRYDKIVVLDAGHGANDPGTQNFGINEKDNNLIIIKLIGKILEEKGIKVIYSRYDDTLIPLRDRAYLGGRVDADMFVSLHHNANNDREKNGTSVYYSLLNYNSSLNNKLTSRIMAQTMQKDLVEALGTNDMEVLTTDFTVTKYNNVPSVLVELCYMSNPDECARAITDDFRLLTAQTLAQSILSFYEL